MVMDSQPSLSTDVNFREVRRGSRYEDPRVSFMFEADYTFPPHEASPGVWYHQMVGSEFCFVSSFLNTYLDLVEKFVSQRVLNRLFMNLQQVNLCHVALFEHETYNGCTHPQCYYCTVSNPSPVPQTNVVVSSSSNQMHGVTTNATTSLSSTQMTSHY